MRVLCINDSKLPKGAEVVKGEEYNVLETIHLPFADQKAYILEGVANEGKRKYGLPWIGYDATRFRVVSAEEKVEQMIEHLLN